MHTPRQYAIKDGLICARSNTMYVWHRNRIESKWIEFFLSLVFSKIIAFIFWYAGYAVCVCVCAGDNIDEIWKKKRRRFKCQLRFAYGWFARSSADDHRMPFYPWCKSVCGAQSPPGKWIQFNTIAFNSNCPICGWTIAYRTYTIVALRPRVMYICEGNAHTYGFIFWLWSIASPPKTRFLSVIAFKTDIWYVEKTNRFLWSLKIN